uniref:Uncharacterized protein n=1 Tax=Aquila chrysaetos chrysaetos TaxID=223781 RepID=A0A663EN06_AQUCH
ITEITSSIVPVSDGRPPSLAVNTKRCSGIVSRSSGLLSTRNNDSESSSVFCQSREKCSLGLRV